MSSLSRYNQSQSDRNTAAHDESLFGHYVQEQGWTVKETLENLAPLAKQTHAQTVQVAEHSKWMAVVGAVGGLLGGASVGLIGALPIGAAFLAFCAYKEANRCIERREIELRALKNCPNLLNLMYGCSLKGAETHNLIAAWDLFLDSYADADNADANLMAREYLRILDGLSFTVASLTERAEQGEVPIPKELPESSPIGNQTRFGAIEVPSVQNTATRQAQSKNALSALLASPYVSRALFGAQRTGKSYLAAIASFELAKTGMNTFHINLMSYGSEDATYWQHVKKSIRCDLPALSVSEGKPFIKQAIALVAEFVQTPNSLLIVDEWAYIASTANPHRDSLVGLLNDISSQITSLSSAGIKRQRGLWAISPEFVAGSLVPQGKAVKKLQLVYVTIHPDRSIDWNGNAIGFSDELFQQVANNFPIDLPDSMELPDCDRVVYINREWMPVGELPALPKSESKAVKTVAVQPQIEDENTTFYIAEMAALRGIETPTIEPDEPASNSEIERPESLAKFPMVESICLYLEGKEPRSLKQIADTMKACKKVSDEDLQQKLGSDYTNYKDGILKILFFGVTQKFIKQVSGDTYTVNY